MNLILKLILCSCVMVMSACSSTVPHVIVEKEYVLRTAPDELKLLPMRSVETKAETDAEAAVWIIHTESYIDLLESKFKKLILFYERPLD